MSKLKPPDLKQCQADKPTGNSFMTLGGRPFDMVRCTNAPTVVATEVKKGDDGERGAMSLCTGCHVQMLKQLPEGFATFEEISR